MAGSIQPGNDGLSLTPFQIKEIPPAIGPMSLKGSATTIDGEKIYQLQKDGQDYNKNMGMFSAGANLLGNIGSAWYQFKALDAQEAFQTNMYTLATLVENHRDALQNRALTVGFELQKATLKSQETLANKENSFKLQKAKIGVERDVRLAEVESLNKKFGQSYNYGSPLQALGIG